VRGGCRHAYPTVRTLGHWPATPPPPQAGVTQLGPDNAEAARHPIVQVLLHRRQASIHDRTQIRPTTSPDRADVGPPDGRLGPANDESCAVEPPAVEVHGFGRVAGVVWRVGSTRGQARLSGSRPNPKPQFASTTRFWW